MASQAVRRGAAGPVTLRITMRNELLSLLLGIGLGTVPGCNSTPTTAPSSATAVVPAGVYQTFRVAEPADLRLSIYGMKPAAKEFPYVLLTVQNISAHDEIVAYERGSLVIHCGSYVQHGPEIFQRRRQILGPWATIVFDPPENGWGELSSDGQPELMIPIKLPPGKYPVWATFDVAGPHGGTIRSDQREYEVR
jgi:hypothetical protein